MSTAVGKAGATAKRRSIRIRYSLARNLMLMILLTSGSILLVSYLWSARIVRALSQELISQRIDQTRSELDRFFKPVENGLLMFRDWSEAQMDERIDRAAISPDLDDELLDPTSVLRMNARFVPFIERFPQVSSLLIADTNGEEYMLLRMSDHLLNRLTAAEAWPGQSFWMRHATGRESESWWKELAYDPRSRAWFEGALATPYGEGVHWTAPYKFFTSKDPGITASVQWPDPESPGTTRVMGFDVLLTDISRFTTQLSVGESGKAMVLTDEGAVIGLPRDPRFQTPEELRAHVLSPVAQLDMPEVQDAVLTSRVRRVGTDAIFRYQSGGESWWAGVRPFSLGTHVFYIVVVVPESDFLAGLVQQRNIVLATTGCALFIAFFVAMALARGYSRPLAALADQASRIQKLDLSEIEPVESILTEVNQLADNQGQMVTALRSFSRYVPFELVRELLELGEVATIGGRRAQLTVLFTDIVGFTSIAERMRPEDLTAHLAEYFSAMLEILQAEKATVDKFVGDAIMAFWGAPLSDPEHSRHALDAVIRCRDRLAELNANWEAQGLPALPTCFGLDVGPLVVGNVGAPSRLNYTVLGDTVNLASRIEGLNRRYGTSALASRAVVDDTGDAYCWRLVDIVAVKGRSEAVEVLEPLGRRGEVAEAELRFAARYEAAFAAYRSGAFETALVKLEEIDEARRSDPSVSLLRDLCRRLRDEPPDGEWDGVSRLDTK